MMDVEKMVIYYVEKTEEILKSLENNEFDMFYILVSERENIIEHLKNMDSNDVSKAVKQQPNIQNIEQKINILIKSKLQEYKMEMANIAKNREAHSAYNDHLTQKIHFNTQV